MTGEIVELFVLRAGDRRTVMSEGVARGNFHHQIDAEEAAIRLAQDARAKGRPSGVMSPDRRSRMRRVWPIYLGGVQLVSGLLQTAATGSAASSGRPRPRRRRARPWPGR